MEGEEVKLIDMDAWWKEAQKLYTDGDCADADRYKVGINVGITASRAVMQNIPSVKTKQIKYFDEDEKVWKIGSVIVDE